MKENKVHQIIKPTIKYIFFNSFMIQKYVVIAEDIMVVRAHPFQNKSSSDRDITSRHFPAHGSSVLNLLKAWSLFLRNYTKFKGSLPGKWLK